MRALIHAQGIVQGVGFRPYVYRLAKGHFLNGYVLNLGDAGVEILIEGEEDSINLFLRGLVDRAPPLANIAKVDVKRLEGPEKFQDFEIRQSKLGGGGSGWVIPPDIAICNDCLKELKDNKDRRHDYYFTTCTNCGPRFTMTYRVPYDRVSTSMRDFNMCSKCGKEYTNPLDRRFHAQTIACPDCGPKLYLTNNNGIKIASRDPIADAINTLRSGSILAIKGIGGFHIACVVTNEDAVEQIRKSKERSQKPFAIMSKDIQTIRNYAEVPPELYNILISPIRPIALLRKLNRVGWVEHVSPGLDTVGVMLPYTGLHYLLLENLDTPALVMTSGNPASEPIIANNDEAVKKLGGFVDLFLMHEREITQKTDDSVVRWTDDHLALIRRSRGYVPTPVRVKQLIPWTIIALGGELNVTSCVLNKQQAFLSQHLGDMDREANYAFNEKVSRYIIAMTRTKIDAVACDLHPQFATTELGMRLSKELDVPLMKIQHHEAHAASILGEHNVADLVAICTDGFGLGSDGLAWGGEVFHCNRRKIQRVGHLQPQPLIGGDLATKYPSRVVAGVLRDHEEVKNWLTSDHSKLPHGEKEAELISIQASKYPSQSLGASAESFKHGTWTTSVGRILDAGAAILGVSHVRTYEGEPAMKLEALARGGKNLLDIHPVIKNNTLDTEHLLLWVFRNRNRLKKKDLAYSLHAYLARGLGQIALNAAEDHQTKAIGFTGGVAFNGIINRELRTMIRKEGLSFLTNREVPPGDGGLSFGQAIAASLWKKTSS